MSIRETILVQSDADLRREINDSGPTIEAVVTQFQLWKHPTPAHALVDPFDLYLWRALADSERQMIALIESRRPQKAVSA